jgi:hypothetical protein
MDFIGQLIQYFFFLILKNMDSGNQKLLPNFIKKYFDLKDAKNK